jgi:hypothetical protein
VLYCTYLVTSPTQDIYFRHAHMMMEEVIEKPERKRKIYVRSIFSVRERRKA